MNLITRIITLAMLVICGQAFAQGAAQNYPNKTIRIIVPFPAGGPTDILARVIGQRMSEDWGQPVVIDNRPGGNTAIGAQLVAKAPPDGYTLLAAMDTTMVMNPVTTRNLPYDPFKDFALITMAANNTSLLTVRAADGPKTVQELIAKAKANPGKLNYGAGTITTRLAGYLFNRMAGIDVVFVPYKGSSDVVQGLLTGSVDFIVDGTASSLPLIHSGKFRALAKLTSRPLPALPEVKALAIAADLPGLEDISTWTGLVAPAGTPLGVIDKIQREVAKMYADPAIVDKLEKSGITATSSTPAEFDAFFRKETDRWTKVFRESGIKFD
jgi:tripartite-type tricarboxylate transporter receptor subunit TctC